MNYYISKPVKIEEMRMAFERACQRLKPEQVLDCASIDNLRDNLGAIRLSDICKAGGLGRYGILDEATSWRKRRRRRQAFYDS